MIWFSKRLRIAWCVVLALALLAVACSGSSQATPQETASDLSQQTATESAGYRGTPLDGSAPDFRLLDQNGASVSLSDFAGKVVVLAFLDSRCNDACPPTALQLAETYRTLGEDAHNVAFLGMNVNADHNGVEDVAAFTKANPVGDIPSWHFLTGTSEELKPVWEAFAAVLEGQQQDLASAPGVFLIDSGGYKRWLIATPSAPGVSASLSDSQFTELVAGRAKGLLSEMNSGSG